MADPNDTFHLPSETDPVLGLNGSPAGYLQLGAEALAPSNIKSWAQPTIDSLTDAGLGLGQAIGRGVEAITPSRDTMQRIFMGLEAGGAAQQGRTPLYLQERQMDQQAQARRDALAQQMAQDEESKRQHDLQLMEKILSSSSAPGVKQKMLEGISGPMANQARQLSKAMKDSDYDSFDALKQYIPQEVQDQFVQGKLPAAELSQWIEMARDEQKVNTREQVKSKVLQSAINTPEEQRNPFQRQLVEEHEAKTELQRADLELKQVTAADKWLKLGQPDQPDRSEDNRIHQALFGGKGWAEGTNETRQKALEYKSKMYAQGKTDVTAGTSLGQLGKQQEFRDPVTGKAAPSWATTAQATQMGFVNIEPTQISTVTQLQNVDEALKEILATGSSLVRQATGHGLFDVPAGMMQTPILQLTKKYAGDPNAALLMSAITRITPSLSKLGGDTGNVAVEERKMYADSIFSDADTVGSLVAKIKSIKQATDRTRSSLGFVPDEPSLIRRLAIMGKSDEQIKAILDERKRMQ